MMYLIRYDSKVDSVCHWKEDIGRPIDYVLESQLFFTRFGVFLRGLACAFEGVKYEIFRVWN